ncbi:hypothetical protein [Saccharicrinis aurantiacus]|uniref:hypothetical protein n=1 Tax=Saccharicrinis aurantiacus TaxID=1849719 RepID=UPI00094FBDC6|nr:hypothetical protein [Saccharicrinis aurantiacus]
MNKYPLVEPQINAYLNNLTKNSIQEVVELFHGKGLKINEIIEQFNLEKIAANTFVRKLPSIQCYDIICPDCQVVSWIDNRSRQVKSKPYCPICKEVLICDFDPISHQRKLAIQKEHEILERKMNPDYYDHEVSISRSQYEKLTLFQKVFLGSIIQAIIEDDLSTVKGKLLKEFKIFPIDAILNNNLSDLGISESLDYTDYKYNIDISVTKELLNCNNKLEASLKEQFILWKEIAMAESKEYLIGEMQHNNFRYHHDNKFNEIFNNLLQEHSVSQTFHLINKSVTDACKLYAQKGNRYLAENSIIGACSRMADYYPTRGWPIVKYERRWNFQSLMSQYFFNKLLKIGNEGFNHPPSLELLIHNKLNK